jgi:hypothetical protein
MARFSRMLPGGTRLTINAPTCDAEFKEGDHPRGPDGKFGAGGAKPGSGRLVGGLHYAPPLMRREPSVATAAEKEKLSHATSSALAELRRKKEAAARKAPSQQDIAEGLARHKHDAAHHEAEAARLKGGTSAAHANVAKQHAEARESYHQALTAHENGNSTAAAQHYEKAKQHEAQAISWRSSYGLAPPPSWENAKK